MADDFEDMDKDGREETSELDGLDLSTAGLDEITEALRRLEGENQGLLEDIRVLRIRLLDEKVRSSRFGRCTVPMIFGGNAFAPAQRCVV